MESIYQHNSNYPSLSIVVPVFNEAENIFENINLLKAELTKSFSSYEIFIVSDGSTDTTNEVITRLNDPLIIPLILQNNQGKGAAVRTGFEHCKGDYILFIDGGMELHPKEIKIFMGLMKLYEADMIIGSKRHPQSKVFYPWYRRFLSYIYQKLVQVLFSVDITDTQVGIKLFRGDLIRDILPYLNINHYGFDLEIISLASAMGYTKILEAPIRLDYFLKNRRSTPKDVFHTLRVGWILFKDTLHLFIKIRKLNFNAKSKTTEI